MTSSILKFINTQHTIDRQHHNFPNLIAIQQVFVCKTLGVLIANFSSTQSTVSFEFSFRSDAKRYFSRSPRKPIWNCFLVNKWLKFCAILTVKCSKVLTTTQWHWADYQLSSSSSWWVTLAVLKKHYWTWRFADDSFFQSLKIYFFCGIFVCFIIRPESI